MDPVSTIRFPVTKASLPAEPARAPDVRPDAAAAVEEDFTFFDFLDFINPLQHIPVVNTIYRELTGDEIKTPAKLIGSAILGGPIGLAAAMVDTAVADATGKDMGEHIVAMFTGEPEEEDAPGGTMLAASPEHTPPTPAQTAAAVQATPREYMPSETEARIAAAQVAAQANVLAPLKRGPVAPSANGSATDKAAAERETERQAMIARANRGVFMPLKRAAAEDRALSVPRRMAPSEPADPAVLKATTRFSPGPLNPGGAALAPAVLAAAHKARLDHQPDAVSAAEAYDYGLAAAEGAPVSVPAWFDAAMMRTLDKYEAGKTAQSQ